MAPTPLSTADDAVGLRDPAGLVGRAGRGVWVLAVVGFFLLMSAWALANPLISGPDEPAHVIRAEAIVRGELIGKPVYPNVQNPYTTVLVPGFLQEAPTFRYWCYIFVTYRTAKCAPPLSGPDHLVRVETYVGHYPPLYYAVVGLPSLAFPGRGGVFVMRLVSAFISALLLGTALWLALGRSRWVALAVLVAATPTVIYYGGSVNPNGMEMSAAVCLWCAVLGLTMPGRGLVGGGGAVAGVGGAASDGAGVAGVGSGGAGGAGVAGVGSGGAGVAGVGIRVEVVVAAVSGSLLAFARGLSPAWVVVAIGAAAVGADSGVVRRLTRRRDVLVAGAVLIASALAAVAWIVGEHGLDELGIPNHQSDASLFRHALDTTPHYLAEMVGIFGANNVPAPAFATTVVVASLALLVVGALAVGSWRQRLVLLALLIGIVAVPLVIDVVSGRHYGLIWQGRYTMAVGVGSPLFAGYVLASWFELRSGPEAGAAGGGWRSGGVAGWLSGRRVSSVVVGVALLLAVGQFTCLLWDLRRFMVGAGGPLSGVLSGFWHPPVDGFVLLIAAACGLLMLTALLLRAPALTQRAPPR